MNKRKNMSDEQLAAYLDKMLEKERRSFKDRFNCFSCRPQMFCCDSRDNDYCVEEDFADDAATLEVLKVSQDAMRYFDDDAMGRRSADGKMVAAAASAASFRKIPGLSADKGAARKNGKSKKKDGDDIIPMPF